MTATNIDDRFADRPVSTYATLSKGRVWAGRILHGLVILFLIMDVVMKLLRMQPAIDATIRLGFKPDAVFTIGLIGLACLIVYVIPRTTLIGALLWTSYLGGAVAIQMRAGSSVFETTFPIYVGIVMWLGLWLRDARVNRLLP
jgi:hypothetical protein